jgi:hypothetical protein
MNKKIAIIPTVLILIAAAYWAGTLRKTAARTAESELAVVLVARYDLPAGTALKEDMLETRTLPRVYMQQDAPEVRDMGDIKLVNGLITLVPVPKGNQLTRSVLRGEAVKEDDKAPQAQRHYVDGMKYFQNADYENARREWEAALKADPANADAQAGLKRLKQVLSGGK